MPFFNKIKLHCFVYVCLAILTFVKCSKTKSNQGYIKDKNSIYYQLLAIGDGTVSPQKESVLLLHATIKTQNDSLLFNSENQALHGFIINLNQKQIASKFYTYFKALTQGDSASFLIPTTLFFRTFFDTICPSFCKSDSIIKFQFKIKDIVTQSQYDHLLTKAQEDNELLELKQIHDYLVQNHFNSSPHVDGIYYLQKKETNALKPVYGDKITVSFQGFYLDGTPIDNKPQYLEFIFGTPDQLIKGLNIVIGNLKKGEFSKIIVPSRLAFGELGSSTLLVQPYTPLLYNITLIDIN